ncbi:MAG: hypothetical protein ACW99G_24600, partial [Candidatus Thorarchaeota archaeon]
CLTISRTGNNITSDNVISGFTITVTASKECIDLLSPGIPVNITWDHPTERENGEALPISEIHQYHIAVNENTYTVPSPETSFTVQLSPGTYDFAIIAEDIYSLKSDPATISKVIQ